MSTWVLLRGLGREAGHWGGFLDVLRSRLDPVHIVALDLPGCGARRAERAPFRVDAMVEACRDALAAEAVAPPYRLLALSLGGMVAAAWSARHPEEVLGAVLINTSLRRFAPMRRRLRMRTALRLLRAYAFGDALASERAILQLTSRHPPADPKALLECWVAIRHQRPVSVVNILRQLWAAGHEDGPATSPLVPVLVLASAGDALVDPECSARIARAWETELGLHPTAGHDLPLDDPEWVVERIAAWLDPWPKNEDAGDLFDRRAADQHRQR
jgi:pimeloyl-ACP methyl ester carboxylesterase